jgi:hypothetical protein
MRKSGLLVIMAFSALLVWTMSCQSPSSSGSPEASGASQNVQANAVTAGTGFLKLILKDALIEDAKNVYVTISNIRVHEACEEDDGCFHTVWENTAGEEIDILALNTVPLIFTTPLPAGKYNQIRMSTVSGRIIFASTDPLNPEDLEFPLKVPSSEIKTQVHFEVAEGGITEITLDLDARNSIHIIKKGKKDIYQLRPVINTVAIGEPAV